MEYTVELTERGSVTLPAALRERYHLEDGDILTVIDLDGVLVLAPKAGLVSRLVGDIERIREEAGLSVSDLIDEVHEDRRRHARSMR